MQKQNVTKTVTVTGMMCALAILSVLLFRIKVQFLTFDIKDAVIAMNSLMFGPIYGVLTALAASFIEAFTLSDTGAYGFIMNFLSSGTFALTCGLIYRYKRTFGGAILAVSMSIISVTTVMLLANLFVTPLFMKVDRAVVISMLPTLFLPFNLLKTSINAAITLALYKPLVLGLKRAKLLDIEGRHEGSLNLKSVLLLIVSVLIIVIAVLLLVLYMNGSIELFKGK